MDDDPIMVAIMDAIAVLQAGRREEARAQFEAIWSNIALSCDPLHECTLAHFMADTQEDPAAELEWDLRALRAAECALQQGTRAHASVPSFLPSLHLNVADAYLRVGNKVKARVHLEAGLKCIGDLPLEGYGAMVRGGLARLAGKLGRSDLG